MRNPLRLLVPHPVRNPFRRQAAPQVRERIISPAERQTRRATRETGGDWTDGRWERTRWENGEPRRTYRGTRGRSAVPDSPLRGRMR